MMTREVAGQLGLMVGTSPSMTSPVAPSMVTRSPRVQLHVAHPHDPGLVVDPQLAGAGDAGPAHAARHHRGVAGHAAAGRQDALGGVHAVDVLGLVSTRQRMTVSPAAACFSASSAVNTILPEAAPGEAGRPRAIDLALGAGVEGRMEQLVEASRDRSAPPPRPR